MTDTGPPTNPGDIVSIGQRRKDPTEAFPERPQIIVWEGTFDEIPADLEEPPPDPCANPATALPWNADAAGAGSIGKFLAKAAEIGFADAPNGVPTLLNREFGNFLMRGTGQSVVSTPVTAGLAGSPTELTLELHNVTPQNYLGDVHSHPFGNPLPSQADWDGFMANNRSARLAGRTGETFYLYIVAVDPNGGPPKIYVYQDGPRAANSADPAKPTTKGLEVNPNAQPCP